MKTIFLGILVTLVIVLVLVCLIWSFEVLSAIAYLGIFFTYIMFTAGGG